MKKLISALGVLSFGLVMWCLTMKSYNQLPTQRAIADIVFATPMMIIAFVLFGGILTEGKARPLWMLRKWEVVTVRAISERHNDAGGFDYLLVETGADKIIYIKMSYAPKDKPYHVGYHYRYNGKALIPLPVGSNK